MVRQGTIRRFGRWGLTHGPAWGMLAGAFTAILLARVLDLPTSHVEFVGIAALAGLILGPALAVCVGAACLAAERAPRWLLDAPDYVAIITVIAAVGLVAWPLFQVLGAGTGLSVLGVALMAAAPSIDAARTVPRLLDPTRSGQPG